METENTVPALMDQREFSGMERLEDSSSQMRIISGIEKEMIELQIRLSIFRIVYKHFKNPIQIIQILKTLDTFRRQYSGANRIKKIIEIDGKYYWDMYIPGWKSEAFDKFFEGEINRIVPVKVKSNRFTNIFIAITKKCPLQCQHCFEGDVLNKKEKLSLDNIKQIVNKFQEKGTGQFQITGGEPMLRINDIVEILKSSKPGTDFWILTSGYQFTYENALKLKEAGCTGVAISLDHFDPAIHNLFRGFKDSYEWVLTAVKNARAFNLVTALSICVTKSFITESNLMEYATMAKKLGVAFIQILEPKPVGNYAGHDVALHPEHKLMLDEFYLKLNYNQRYREYPIIIYHGYYQRRLGCLAAGNRNVYIDTDGDIHACPFCQTKMGSAITDTVEESIAALQQRGCHSFKTAEI